MTRVCYTSVFALIMFQLHGQLNTTLTVITPSPYTLRGQLIIPDKNFTQKIKIPAAEFEVIDNRYDNSKQGFYPMYKSPPKVINFNQPLSLWMYSQLDQMLETQPDSSRKLVFVVQKFWFNTTTVQKFSPFKQNLEVSLLFKVELFSAIRDSYYPLRRIEKSFTTVFNEEDCYKKLVDSFFETLQKDLPETDYAGKETQQHVLTQDHVASYLQTKIDRLGIVRKLRPGVYETFNDFINQKIMGDSVELVSYSDYYGKQTVACHVGVYVRNSLQPCNKCWGYYDGRFLFINAGEGFFIKLTPWYNQFILADLQQIVYAKKKKPFISEIQISTSSYDVIKDYAKAYHLFFQLDYDDGKIY